MSSCTLTRKIEEKYSDIDGNLESSNNDIIVNVGIQAINNSIGNILTIRKYEVVGQPTEFIDLYKYLHEFADELTFISVRQEVKDALLRFEPRIIVDDVIAEMSEESSQLMLILVIYHLKETDEEFKTLVKIEG